MFFWMFGSNKYNFWKELFLFSRQCGRGIEIKTGQRYRQNNAVTSLEAITLAYVTQSNNEVTQ